MGDLVEGDVGGTRVSRSRGSLVYLGSDASGDVCAVPVVNGRNEPLLYVQVGCQRMQTIKPERARCLEFLSAMFFVGRSPETMTGRAIGVNAFLGVMLIGCTAMGKTNASTFTITDYGARGDGKSDSTKAIREAIAQCAGAGGGRVVVPAGRFVSGTIELRDHVELHVSAGAVLEASKALDDYMINGRKRGLIYAADAEHVAVTGLGILHGHGTHFTTDTTKPLENTTGRFTRQETSYQAEGPDGPKIMGDRPGSLIHFSNCRQIAIQDVTIKDAPEWTIRLSECDGVQIRGIRILNNPLIPNNDGIHCVTSSNVRIADCDVRAGDDAIAITGLYGTPGAVTENITVTNCTLQSRSSGVRIGYGSNSIRRCTFDNLVIHDSNRGIGVFVREEGSISDILFSNIIIQTRLHTGDWWGHGEPIHVSCIRQKDGVDLGRIENVRFSNILADSEHGMVVYGDREQPIRDLMLSNVHLKLRASTLNDGVGGNFDLRPAGEDRYTLFAHDIPALYAGHVENMRVKDFEVAWDEGFPDFFTQGIMCEAFQGLHVEGFRGRQARPGQGVAAIALLEGRDVVIRDCRAMPGTGVFLESRDIKGTRLLADNDLTLARQIMSPASDGWNLRDNLMPAFPEQPERPQQPGRPEAP